MTHHLAKAEPASQGGKVIDARVVDLALWLITREGGAFVAAGVESIMEYEQRGVVWRSA